MKQKILSVLCAAAVFFLILTVSIGLPIYIRPFYYAHIESMDLPQRSGFTAQEIRAAYDEVLDYLTIPGREFGTGVMAHSAEGKAHFADCKVLFDLNASILAGSAAVLLVLYAMRKKWGPYRLGKRSAAFWAAALALAAPMIIGALAALDFNRAFVVFHSIFFPGKTNWVFDWNADQIIRVLPQDFFMHCAILIGAGLVAISLGIIVREFARKKTKEQVM